MRKLLYLGFCLMLAAGFGCAITDYGIITDNNQTKAGAAQVDKNRATNTAGKAHIIETSQVATIWPDGTDELFSFVDQKYDATATITTYNNFSTGSEPIFHSDLYCNTAWSGCAIFTAPDNNGPILFDGSFNGNCAGARSLSVLLATGRYYGECGKDAAKLSVQEKISLIGSAVEATAFGRTGLLWDLDSSNTSMTARNLETGQVLSIPFFGASFEHFLSNSGNVAFTWLDHALLGVVMRDIANKLDHQLNAEGLEFTINHNGVPMTFTIAGGEHQDVNSKHWRLRANSSF